MNTLITGCLLVLSTCHVTIVTATRHKLCHFSNDGVYHVLNCTNRDLIEMPQPLPEAQVLDFRHNRFMEFPEIYESESCEPHEGEVDCDGPHQCRHSIDFSRNEIATFHPHALHALRCLRTLDLSYNQITESILTPYSFQEGSYRLNTLDLRGNPIGKLPDHVLVEPFMPNLRYLDLSHCQLTEIGENSVDDFRALRTLNLSYNSLKTLAFRTFKGLDNLYDLDLRHNQLTHLPELVFADLVNLHLLQLSDNLVHSFHSGAFTKDSHLQELVLNNNKLTTIPYSAVDKLPMLKILDLSYNPIHNVNRGLAVSSVTTLYLDHLHSLESLDKDALASFPALFNLSISNNPKLVHIHPLMLADNSSALRNLNMRNNALTTLPANAVPFQQLKSLQLSGNHWICDDRIIWMILASPIKPNTAKCAEPRQLKGVFIRSLNPNQIQRFVSIAPVGTIIGVIISLPVAALFAYLIWKRRHHCACTSVTIKGRYVSVFTRDDDDSKVTFDLQSNMERLTAISNGKADDSEAFIKMEVLNENTGPAEEVDEISEEI